MYVTFTHEWVNWTNSRLFQIRWQYIFARRIWSEKSRICSIWGQSHPFLAQILHLRSRYVHLGDWWNRCFNVNTHYRVLYISMCMLSIHRMYRVYWWLYRWIYVCEELDVYTANTMCIQRTVDGKYWPKDTQRSRIVVCLRHWCVKFDLYRYLLRSVFGLLYWFA